MIKKKLKKAVLFTTALMVFLLSACFEPNGDSFLTVNSRQCTGCARCEKVCPVDAIQIIDGKAIIDPTECIECGKCVEECPEDAIY